MLFAETETCSCPLALVREAAGCDPSVGKYDERMALCDNLKTCLERAKTTREQFATSISHALSAPESIPA